MALRSVEAREALAQGAAFDSIIDVRSPSEFAEDHLPGAVNWPVLDDEERRIVGTLYVQVSPHEARKVGAAMVARRIAGHLERWVHDAPREWRPLVYCWRGGQRSGTMAWFLDQIGFRTARLAGGYKAFRTLVREDLARPPSQLQLRVLCGRTGSGKTRLLHALRDAGAQVLDLEGLAHHRGSVLGAMPGRPQPSQKHYDTLIWQALREADPARPLWLESESRKVGALHVPEALHLAMREQAECIRIETPDALRVQLLLEDYAAFAQDPAGFARLLDGLIVLRGRAVVEGWQADAHAGRWAEVYADLMHRHYDPLYDRSMANHYPALAQARTVVLDDVGPAGLRAVAERLLAGSPSAGA